MVTSFEYRLHPVGSILGGRLIHPQSKAKDLLTFYRDFIKTAPERLGAYAGLLTAPDGTPVAAIIAYYNDPPEEGEKVVRPLREFGQPIADEISPTTHGAMQTLLDEAFPPGNHNYWKSSFLKDLNDEAIEVLADDAAKVTSPLSAIVVE